MHRMSFTSDRECFSQIELDLRSIADSLEKIYEHISSSD